MRRLLPTIPLVLASTLVQAQALNLSTALTEVSGDSPTVAGSASMAEEADWKRQEAWGGFIPRLRMGGTYLTDKKYQFININFAGSPTVIPTIIPNSQFNLTAELPLFDGFASTNRLWAAQNHAQAARENFDWTKFRTEMEVTVAFYQALASKQLRDVAEQNLKVLEDHLKDARLFRKGGLSTNYDVLRVEVQVSNARTDLADAEDEIIISQERLAEVLGHEKEARPLEGDLPVPREEVISEANGTSANRADLRALRLQALARSQEESAAGRFWVPEFTFFGQYVMYNNLSTGLNDWDAYRNSRQVGFSMNWNLWDGGVSYSRSRQAVERKVQSEKALRAQELAAKKDLSVYARRYRSQCRIYQARVEDVSRSEESVRLAREGKRAGARADSDLLDAEADLYRSRAGVVRAQLAAVEALVKLQLAEGRRYKEFR